MRSGPPSIAGGGLDLPFFPFVISGRLNRSLFYRAVKRMIDLLGAVALLLVFSPVLGVVTLVLWITTRGNPIFR